MVIWNDIASKYIIYPLPMGIDNKYNIYICIFIFSGACKWYSIDKYDHPPTTQPGSWQVSIRLGLRALAVDDFASLLQDALPELMTLEKAKRVASELVENVAWPLCLMVEVADDLQYLILSSMVQPTLNYNGRFYDAHWFCMFLWSIGGKYCLYVTMSSLFF